MIKDRHRFGKMLMSKGKRQKLAGEVADSVALAEARRQALPKPQYPENLPVARRVADIKAAIQNHQVVIIAGETGSGKTTQIPKICLELGRGVHGLIGHTQPRRVAARTVGARIAEELNVKFGESVGYQVRFTDQTNPMTHVKVMTDGILLAETAHDKFLEAYDTIIIDEAHERSLNIDFLLGYLKRILPRRPDLKLIVTSATIDVERFSRHFSNAPVIEVSGRTYPVEVHYRPLQADNRSQDADELMTAGIIDVLHEIEHLERRQQVAGDVLIFLSGEREIRELAHQIRKSDLKFWEVLPLYSRLSVAEQNRVFAPHQGRRIVLATNVAETSLTVPGIRYVIDPGLARISRYSVRSKVQQLPVEPVSQASAEQRKGRCGRVSNGVCFRLYSEEDFLSRPEFTQPEILRTNLGSVILQMLILRLGDMNQFPFVERPDQRQINDGFQLLHELGAVDDRKQLSKLGREMARFPVDLKLARMLIEANKRGSFTEVLTIVSALAIQDPRERPHDKQQAADEKHRQHWDDKSDFIAYLNLWNHYEENRQRLTQGQLRRFCRDNFISYIRMREWRDNHRQLHLVAKELKYRENTTPADYEDIHRALLAGLLGNIGERTEDNEYLGARNRKHFIFPGSSQANRKPGWIMSAELVETSRLFARTVARIESEWIEPLAQHLVKRNYQNPRYSRKRGQVLADEEVMLYGINIVKKRPVDFGNIDQAKARQVFIQEALVEQYLNSKAGFYRHNCKLIEEIEQLESRSRKRDILVDNYTIFRFYDERLPAHITSDTDLHSWRKAAEARSPKLLYLDREFLMKQEAELPEELYPKQMQVADTRLRLDYHFDPQHEDDGVSMRIPVALLRQVSREQLDWLIPGLLREKCLALLKSLPKAVRKNFVPAPDHIDRVLPQLVYDGRDLTIVLAEKLFRATGVRVQPEMFDPGVIDRHLKMNLKVLDASGKVIGSGRDLERLRQEFAETATEQFNDRSAHQLEQQGLTDWTLGDLPESVDLPQAGLRLRGYPALVDERDSVAVRIVDNQPEAERLSQAGLLRLIMLRLADQRKYVARNIPGFRQFSIYYATRGSAEELLNHMVEAIFRFVFIEDEPLVRSRAEFEARLEKRLALIETMNQTGRIVQEVLKLANETERRLESEQNDINQSSMADIRQQLSQLLAPGFMAQIPFEWFRHYPRYLRGIIYRLDRLSNNIGKDHEATRIVAECWDRYSQLSDQGKAEMSRYRWLIEELRVSLFAQPLGTSQPVSVKRLEKEWVNALRDPVRKQRLQVSAGNKGNR
ncbi:MAG: ATP-dependent RNA helicase HrpA [Pseudomonadales bacterium]|nr:ATP-dependent RNA helicase HrpA [Pseudomonadales bacterium]